MEGKPIPDEDLPFTRVISTREPVWNIEHTIEHTDGSTAILSVNAAPFFDAGGSLSGVVASINEITQADGKTSLVHGDI